MAVVYRVFLVTDTSQVLRYLFYTRRSYSQLLAIHDV